jgi:hypothetical protein
MTWLAAVLRVHPRSRQRSPSERVFAQRDAGSQVKDSVSPIKEFSLRGRNSIYQTLAAIIGKRNNKRTKLNLALGPSMWKES